MVMIELLIELLIRMLACIYNVNPNKGVLYTLCSNR